MVPMFGCGDNHDVDALVVEQCFVVPVGASLIAGEREAFVGVGRVEVARAGGGDSGVGHGEPQNVLAAPAASDQTGDVLVRRDSLGKGGAAGEEEGTSCWRHRLLSVLRREEGGG